MKTIFFILLKILYVSTQVTNSCQYFPETSQLSTTEENGNSTNQNLECKMRCRMPEKAEINSHFTNCHFMVSLSEPISSDNFAIMDDEDTPDIFELKVIPNPNLRYFELFVILKENKTLDYQENDKYSVYIRGGNSTEEELLILILVQINVCKLPIWTNLPSIVKIPLTTSDSTVKITAIPGQGCENEELFYSVTNKTGRDGSVTIYPRTGEISISYLNMSSTINYISFDVTVFYSYNLLAKTEGHVIVLLDPIDNPPKVDPNGNITLNVPQNGTTLYNITVTDIDWGYNSGFSVQVDVPAELQNAVVISPTEGFGNKTLEMKVDSDEIVPVPYDRRFAINITVQSLQIREQSDTLTMQIFLPGVNVPDGNSGNFLKNVTIHAVMLLWTCIFLIQS